MNELPADWGALCSLVFLLGMRHGFDADHLAAIDGLTRQSSRAQRRFARSCGALFSVGHGTVVVAIAAAVGVLSDQWSPPDWLNLLGTWISIAFLVGLGLANLHAVFSAAPGSVVSTTGWKVPLFGRLINARKPIGVAAVGALFAISFDTVSQAALFGATASRHGGIVPAVALGLLFMLGMLLTDGLNGWWISRLLSRADRLAAVVSRILGAAVGSVSLLVAAFAIGKLASPSLDAWSEGKELFFGLSVVLLVALAYVAARRLGREPLSPLRKAV